MATTSTANVVWNGDLTTGSGQITANTGAFDVPYSLKSRTGEEANTNPEELIAGAHAACYSMMITALLTKAGTPPTSIATSADVTLDVIDGAFTITTIALTTEGDVPGITEDQFMEFAEDAKVNCPVSRALAGAAEITLTANFLQPA